MAGPKKRLSKGAIAGIVVLSTLVVAVVVLLLALPGIVANKVAEAGQKRGLTISYSGYSLGFGSVGLDKVKVTPTGSTAFTLEASSVVAELSWFKPKLVRIPGATLKLDGSTQKIQKVLEAIRVADAKIPKGERVPVQIDGKFSWRNFAGDLGTVSFDTVKIVTTPTEEKVEVDLDKGRFTFLLLTVEPISGKVVRKGKALDVTVNLKPKDAGTAKVVLHHEDGDEATLEVQGLQPKAFLDFEVPGLKLKKATLDADVKAARSADGDVSASGTLSATKLELPKIPVGPVSLSLGSSLGLDFKITPKKNAGDVKIDKANVTFSLGGKPRVVKVTGEASLGETLQGPYAVDLAYTFGPVPCSELASELVGGAVGGLTGVIAGGLASKAVSGNLAVNGTIKGDPTRPDKLVRTTNVTEACKMDTDPVKAVGDLFK